MADLPLCREEGMLAGVCAGLATHFNIDANLIRIFAIVGLLGFMPLVLVVYALSWILIPRREDVMADSTTALDFREPEDALKILEECYGDLKTRLENIESITASKNFRLDIEYRQRMH